MKRFAPTSRRPLNLICTFAALDIILETTFIREELLGGAEPAHQDSAFPGG
jgi:hypothetical protein